ncbi:hypothetical protein ONZ43_g2093 [Nemania bipapillata]|uniref:Uncharacterized protein n=1 Tax=Nemania bipapillata TaxID=110536 RepID=A0ACC2J1V2_9PEZI|nr:hypothetical protein ONZ43_g2093 [Nemania bipapillata]
MDVLLEEAITFADKLKTKVGDNHAWGNVFTLYDDVVNLTFDMIVRVTLDYQTNEQTAGPSPLFTSIRRLTTHVKKPTLITKIERWLPAYRRDVSLHTKTINSILVPHIQARLARKPEVGGRQTVIDLCLKEISTELNEQKVARESSDYIDVVLSQVKVFILAGHHTTAQAICWVLYEVYKNPEVLKKLRDEHDQILGPNPKDAQPILSQQPHKLKDLRYTAAVIKETLRVHALSQTHREGSSKFNFSIDDVIYPTDDTMIQTVPAATQARPDLWAQVTEFIPDRFLVPVGDALYPPKNAWRPFELGIFTLRALEFSFGSTDLGTEPTQPGKPNSVDGNYIYRVGNGLGYVKGNLPTRVKAI